ETVDINNMKINKLGRVSTGYEKDRVFMGVFVFFKGRETKLFYVVGVLLRNEEFPVKYDYKCENTEDWITDLVYVDNEKDLFLMQAKLIYRFRPDKTGGWNNLRYDWKFTIRKLYEL